MLNRNILLYGHEVLPPKPLLLRAGPLTMSFEPDTVFLRYVRLGDHEIVRNIYAVVRDQNWNTIAWKVSNLKADARADSFDLTFDVDCHEREVQYFWKGAVRGTADGIVTYSFDGEAKAGFRRNRIGICVLHPVAECAGKAVTLEHTDGTREETAFPKSIAPWQPLKDVRAITHEVAAGVRAEVRFEGEVFETEDQRNYGDASFKTYSTPQDLPKPVALNPGDRVQHKVVRSPSSIPSRKKFCPWCRGEARSFPFRQRPCSPNPRSDCTWPSTANRSRNWKPNACVRCSSRTCAPTLRLPEIGKRNCAPRRRRRINCTCRCNAGSTSVPDAEPELAEFARELEVVRPKVSLWIIYQQGHAMAPPEVIQLARRQLAGFGAQILLAAGATPFFTEFNRDRPPADSTALPCYPNTPQVHLKDRGDDD